MIEYLEELKSRLSKEDAERLNAIYAPKEVAVPPADAYQSLCVMPDGEIRCYGKVAFSDLPDGDCREIYISSWDCGLSWKEYNVKHGTIGAAVKSPWSGRYLTPTEPYETNGRVDNVVFPCGAIADIETDTIRIYYGAADTCIGLATGKLSELIAACKNGK